MRFFIRTNSSTHLILVLKSWIYCTLIASFQQNLVRTFFWFYVVLDGIFTETNLFFTANSGQFTVSRPARKQSVASDATQVNRIFNCPLDDMVDLASTFDI